MKTHKSRNPIRNLNLFRAQNLLNKGMAALTRKMTLVQIRLDRLLRDLRAVDTVVKQALFILGIGLAIEEVPSLVADLYPSWSMKETCWFLSPSCLFKTRNDWMLKYMADGLWDVLRAYLIAKIAKQYSLYLFLAMAIYVGYEVVGFFMLLWDFKTTHVMFYDFLVTGVVLVKGAFKGYSKETIAKIKSIF